MSDEYVLGYWDCKMCGEKHIRGDNQKCTSCGSPILNETEFYMTEYDKEHPVYVPADKIKRKPNWFCYYCGFQNSEEDLKCYHCSAERSNSFYNTEECTANRENNSVENTTTASTSPVNDTSNVWICSYCDNSNDINTNVCSSCGSMRFESENINSSDKISKGTKFKSSNPEKIIKFALKALLIVAIIFGITVTSYKAICYYNEEFTVNQEVTEIGWSRSVEYEIYSKVKKSDWSTPLNAYDITSKEEIRSYKKVLDHYETKTKTETYREQDGYTYKDLGNGQFKKTPKYVTKTKTVTYQEPVYREEPVYDTKYTYYINEWKYYTTEYTEGNDRNPYYPVANLDKEFGNELGNIREGNKTENYYVIAHETAEDLKKERDEKYFLSYEKWLEYNTGDTFTVQMKRKEINKW